MQALSIGILLGSEYLHAWQATSIKTLCRIEGVRLVAAIVHDGETANDGLASPRRSRLVEWYLDRDSAKHALPRSQDPLAVESLTELIRGTGDTTVTHAHAHTEIARVLTDSSIELLLDLTTAPPLRDLASIPRLGIWRHDLQDRAERSSSPFGLLEVFRDEPTITSTLYRVGLSTDDDLTLNQSVGATNRYSVRKTLNEQLWKVAAFAPRTLSRILTDTESTYVVFRRPAISARISDAVMSLLMVRMLLRRLAIRVRQALFMEQWFIAFQLVTDAESDALKERVNPVVSVTTKSAAAFRIMMPPKDRVWADPFPYVHEGRHYLFYEEVRDEDGKGRIVVSEVSADGVVSEPRSVLERPYHLSYPFVFDWKGTTWMIPESGANRTVELYRAERFPETWVLDRILLEDVAACDATIFERDGRWWMFVTIAPDPSEAYWDELHLYSSQSPLGPWAAHVNNPVRSDVRDSRPAGRVVETQRGLVRPSQDCSRGYGRAIVLHRVDTLDDGCYGESEIGRLNPDWHDGLTGTHTINHCGRLVAIDGKVRRPRYW